MMLLVPSTVYLLVIAFSGVAARAVDANITSLPTSNISSSMLSNSSNVTTSSQSCTDINTCRTKNQIVVSCLVTILACVWFAVHRNVPGPRPKPSQDSQRPNLIVGAAQYVWSVVLRQREAAIVFVVALLAPEWILAWAMRQAIVAWKLVRKLEEAREDAVKEQEERRSRTLDLEKDEGDILASTDGHSSIDRAHTDSEESDLIKRRYNPSISYSNCDKCEGRGNACERVASERRAAKGDESWTWSHGFLIAMGGFQFYNTDGPLYPLSPAAVVELVRRGHLVPPTADEIADKSKGDALSKGVAMTQTLWFVVQCIARRAKHLPVTSLEVMTLAYTVMTVAMYMAWWAKPLNVSCAVRVPEEEIKGEEVRKFGSIAERIFVYVIGAQDAYVDLRQCTRVPTFWSADVDGDDGGLYADIIAFLVAMVFGAVHCIAWHSEFQSPLELQLWRSSAIAITAFPITLIVTAIPVALLTRAFDSDAASRLSVGILFTPVAIVYVAARLTLITLSFTSLKVLPFGAYQTVQWTTFVPHI